MEQAALDHLTEQFARLVRERFPDARVRRVAVLQYGDDPGIEPDELLPRIILEATGSMHERHEVLEAFRNAHRPAMHELRRELDRFRQAGPLEFVAGEDDGEQRAPRMRMGRDVLDVPGPGAPDGPLVPVMARLGQADLETVDALITAGIAANRADAVRWVLARIRERPAYEQLKQRTDEIKELKAQF